MRIRGTVFSVLLGSACATPPPPLPPPPASTGPVSPVPAPPPAASPPAATIDGRAVTVKDLEAHAAATMLARAEALDDLIDLTLLRRACAEQGVTLEAGRPSAEARAAAELGVARKLSLEVPPAADVLVVDHAWIKDAKKASATAKQKKSLEALRALVVAGQPLPKAFETLKGVDGNAWHIGDHEEYPYGVVPPEAHDLAPGSVSPVVPGDGGLHLFTIHARKTTPPPTDAVHVLVRERLREGKTIEIVDAAVR